MPDVARRLIQLYAPGKGLVADPFCGSGGVLVESTISGHPSVGLDINPLACLLARVKTRPIDPKSLRLIWKRLNETINEKTRSINNEFAFSLFEKAKTSHTSQSAELFAKAIEALNEPDLNLRGLCDANTLYWFKPQTIIDLVTIFSSINQEIHEQETKEFFLVCLSSTVRQVSGTRKGEWKLYRFPASKWEEHNPNTFKVYESKVLGNIERMDELFPSVNVKNLPTVNVFNADCRKIFDLDFPEKCKRLLYNQDDRIISGNVDLVVTSPPYGDSSTTVAYGQFSRYSLLFMGEDLNRVMKLDEKSLGGEPLSSDKGELVSSKSFKEIFEAVSKKDSERAKQVRSFFSDLNICLANIFNILKEEGTACLVLGNRNVAGQKIPTDRIIIELGEKIGFKSCPQIHYRKIPKKRIPWRNKAIETMSIESIIILKKGKS